MLEELKNLNYRGGKDGILFFLQKVLGNTSKTKTDINIICSHGVNGRFYSSDELIQYCQAFNWIRFCEGQYSVSPVLIPIPNSLSELNNFLVKLSVNYLFTNDIFTPDMFTYDSVFGCFCLRNELLDLSFSAIRNVLTSQGFFVILHNNNSTRFCIDTHYENLVAQYCKEKNRLMSLKQLEEKLKINKEAGEKAELFVMDYEQNRLGIPLASKVKRISEIDVSAGYDIVSFQSSSSTYADCFIEVKAVTSDNSFYWSKNEYETAKLKGNQYFLYLVMLSKINELDYSPKIIQNPADCIMHSDSWLVESQAFFIRELG